MMKKNVFSAVALMCGAAMIAAGLALEQNASVLAKAVRVCLECVGIG